MEKYIEIISYSLTALITLISLISVFLSSRKSKLAGKESATATEEIENLKEINEDISTNYSVLEKLEKIISYIPEAIKQSETAGINNGVAKKMYALSLIMLKCSEIGLDYQENANLFSNKIEDLITFSKTVNSSSETKEEE